MEKNIYKIGIITIFLCVFSICFLLSAGSTEEWKPSKLINVEADEAQTGKAEVIIYTDVAVQFKHFKIASPPMIIVDLLRTTHDWPVQMIEMKGDIIKKIRSAQNQDKPDKITRVVIELKEMVPYEARRENEKIIIEVSGASGIDNVVKTVKAAAVDQKDEEALPVPKALLLEEDVETFVPVVKEKKAPEPVVEKLPEEKVKEVKAKEPDKSVNEVKEKIPQITIVKDEVKPVQIEAPEKKGVVSTKKIQVPIEEETTNDDNEKYITLDFKDADIRDILRVLSLKSGLNIVYGDDVRGTVTVHLDKVSFQDAMNIILKISGYAYEEITPNVIKISTPSKIAKDKAIALTITKVLPLKYSQADNITGILTPLLTSQGKIQIDSRTNSLVVTDIPENLNKIEGMIVLLDVETRQVMIEAQIVEINSSDLLDLGINWKLDKNTGTTDDYLGSGNDPVLMDGYVGKGKGDSINLDIQAGAESLTGGIRGDISWGTIMNDMSLQLALRALDQEGKGKVLSNPKIITVSNREAKILVGDKVPYKITTVSAEGQTESTGYIDVGIKLLVIPIVNPDNKITLKVHPEVSFVKEFREEGPWVSTREADTEVLVRSGETIVIGGLIKEEETEAMSKIPLLGDLPVLGYLFSRKESRKEKTELIVFITPTLLPLR